MKSTHTLSALILIATAVLGGCASYGPQPASRDYSAPSQSSTGYGVVDSIQVVRADNNTSGTGAIVGGLVGGLLGNQVGGGSGKTAATAVGVVGGALVGNNMEKNRAAQTSDMYQIRVRLDNGDSMTIVQDSVYDLRIGSQVRVADGRAHRY